MNTDRREFLKILGLGGLVIATGGVYRAEALKRLAESEDPVLISAQGKKFGMVVDAGACIGCRQCMYACKEENNVPDAPLPMNWIELFEMDVHEPITELGSVPPEDSRRDYTESPKRGKWYMSVNCFHCENPPCVKVCPVGATFLGEDGIVEMDYDKCIGCRNCMAACPYNARRFNWAKADIPEGKVNPEVPVRPKGVAEKCTFCKHRTREGLLPICVEVCPVGARHFGDLNDHNSGVSQILSEDMSFRLIEEMSTKPKLFYITSGKKWLQEG
jgi:molybdopterin-containing oxidoreductase family iron-sulfur binding subunit